MAEAGSEAGAAIYQLHARSWLRRAPRRSDPKPGLDDPAALDEALAARLVPYARSLGFTQIELLAADTPAELPRFEAGCAANGLTLLPRIAAWTVAPEPAEEVALADPADLANITDRSWRFATLRARRAADWALPGPRRIAMGAEFAQPGLPSVDTGLAWHLLADPLHEGMQRLVHDLNHLGPAPTARLVATNPSTAARPSYRIGVAAPGRYVERIATASSHYGGAEASRPNGGIGGPGGPRGITTEPVPWGGHPHSLVLNLPALHTSILEGPR